MCWEKYHQQMFTPLSFPCFYFCRHTPQSQSTFVKKKCCSSFVFAFFSGEREPLWLCQACERCWFAPTWRTCAKPLTTGTTELYRRCKLQEMGFSDNEAMRSVPAQLCDPCRAPPPHKKKVPALPDLLWHHSIGMRWGVFVFCQQPAGDVWAASHTASGWDAEEGRGNEADVCDQSEGEGGWAEGCWERGLERKDTHNSGEHVRKRGQSSFRSMGIRCGSARICGTLCHIGCWDPSAFLVLGGGTSWLWRQRKEETWMRREIPACSRGSSHLPASCLVAHKASTVYFHINILVGSCSPDLLPCSPFCEFSFWMGGTPPRCSWSSSSFFILLAPTSAWCYSYFSILA